MPIDHQKYILGFNIFDGKKEQLLDYVDAKLSSTQVCLFYANSNLMQHCHQESHLYRADNIVMANDGIALDMVAWGLTGHRFTENLNGTDFTPYLLQHSQCCRRAFLLGGRPGVAEQAAKIFTDRHGVEIVGWANGFEDMRDLPALIQRINQLKPDAILVALGNPQQERWILQYRAELNAKLLVGVGALLDFMSGSVKRAPGWLRSLRLEWLYRLYGEPKRLFKRYTIEMLRFFILCLKWRLSATFRLQ